MEDIDLTGQVALVTGGGRGIGRATAISLALSGASVCVTSRSQGQLEETVSIIEGDGGKAIAVSGNVSDKSDVKRTVSIIHENLGPVDILVNNAGIIGPVKGDLDIDADEWWKTFEVNVRGAYLFSHAVLPSMVSRRQGTIVNVSSIGAMKSFPYIAAYAASKAALTHFASCLALEVKDYGVSIFSFDPGGVHTSMSDYLADSPDVHPFIGDIFRKGRSEGFSSSIEECVKGLMFLVSGKADALSGRFLSFQDDMEDLVQRIDEIESNDLYALRRPTLP